MKFKDNLRKARTRAGFSQEKLAEEMSVSRQTISKWENGDTYPSTKHIFMLTKILGCSVDELVDNGAGARRPVDMACAKSHKKYAYVIVGAVTTLMVVFGFMLFGFVNYGTSGGAIGDSKIAVFDKIIDGSLDGAITAEGYVTKKIVGYGVAKESGTFYIKCDLYNDSTGNPCPAIIYFCKDDEDYSCYLQYLDNPDYVPEGEYYKVG